MRAITIAWREGLFGCEYHRETDGGWLLVTSGGELLAREHVASVSAAYRRGHELSGSLEASRAKRA